MAEPTKARPATARQSPPAASTAPMSETPPATRSASSPACEPGRQLADEHDRLLGMAGHGEVMAPRASDGPATHGGGISRRGVALAELQIGAGQPLPGRRRLGERLQEGEGRAWQVGLERRADRLVWQQARE